MRSDTDTPMTHILNYGGGIQTAAICILVAQKRLPKPDCVIVADTGREMPTTWEYADTYMRPLLASVNLELHRAGHELATVDLYAHNGDLLLPVNIPQRLKSRGLRLNPMDRTR